jgi:hypothetical protein
MAAADGRHRGREQRRHRRREARDADGVDVGLGVPAQVGPRLLPPGVDRVGVREQGVGGASQLDAAPPGLQQRHAEVLRELPDLLRGRRRRHVHRPGRGGDRAVPLDGTEHLQSA